MSINDDNQEAAHYSLRWNNHQAHMLSSFEALLHASTLVDVSLVCATTTIRAHKVVLSACSPFFQRIFAENPCKHPVIVLHEFSEWEVQTLVDFMYRGEISVGQEQLPSLIRAADSLQIRGLTPRETTVSQQPTPSTSPHDSERSSQCETSSTIAKLPHMSHLNFAETLSAMTVSEILCGSPLPRRKQARPRRRSGELPSPQDLSSKPIQQLAAMTQQPTVPPVPTSQSQPPLPPAVHQFFRSSPSSLSEETAEDLCVKKERASSSPSPSLQPLARHSSPVHRSTTPIPPPPAHIQSNLPHNNLSHHPRPKQPETPPPPPPPRSPQPDHLDFRIGKDYGQSPPLHTQDYGLPPPPPHPPGLGQHSPMSFPPMPSVSALAMTQPHSKFFGLDAPIGLFQSGLDAACRNPLLDMTAPRNLPDPQMFVKKKMGRPKGQHSAPRGGPPRSWTNGELTLALQQVWNKRMTTSQASRVYGIPYNSLLMYVRGKYGKSLKLEQLRKDCTGNTGVPLDMMALGGSNSPPGDSDRSDREHHRERDRDRNSGLHGGNADTNETNNNSRAPLSLVSDASPDLGSLPASMFNHFPHNFYPDFGAGFPIPVNMLHLLPPTDKLRGDPFGHLTLDDDVKSGSGGDHDLNNLGSVASMTESSGKDTPPSSIESTLRPEIAQHNGQD